MRTDRAVFRTSFFPSLLQSSALLAWLPARKFSREMPIRGRGGAVVTAEDSVVMDVTRLFAADVILPVQVVHPPTDGWLRRLCLAILEDAFKCLEVCAVRRGHVTRA